MRGISSTALRGCAADESDTCVELTRPCESTARPMCGAGRARLVALNGNTDAIILAIGKEERAVLRRGIRAPSRSLQLRSLSSHRDAKVRPGLQLLVIERTAHTIAHHQPASFAAGLQSIGLTPSSFSHARSMPQLETSSARSTHEHWMAWLFQPRSPGSVRRRKVREGWRKP